MVRFSRFPGSQVIKMVRVPIFLDSQIKKSSFGTQTSKLHKKSAAFGCYFVFCTDVSWTSKVKDISIISIRLMEHMLFEAKLCSEILILKEKSNFGYTDHPEKPALID